MASFLGVLIAGVCASGLGTVCYHDCDSPPLNKCWHFCVEALDQSTVKLLQESAELGEKDQQHIENPLGFNEPY